MTAEQQAELLNLEQARYDLAAQQATSPNAEKSRVTQAKETVTQVTGQAIAKMPMAASILFLVVALILHYFHSQQNFALTASFLYLYLLFGLVLGAFVALTTKQSLREYPIFIVRYVLLSGVLGFGIPVAIRWVFENFLPVSPFTAVGIWAIVFFPLFVLYLVFDSEFGLGDGWRHVASWWLVGWFIFALLVFLTSYTIPFDDVYSELDVSANVGEAWGVIWDGLTGIGDRTREAIDSTSQRLDPNYYTGQVEQNEDRPLGVRLEDVEPIDPVFFPESPITITGYIVAETFLDQFITVDVTCAERQRANAETFEVGYEVYFGRDEFFECEFEDGFDTGSYTVAVEANFPFETWADISYDFITEEKSRTLARLGVDVYQELDISREPPAIYTNGPVMIGMGGSRLPVIVTDEEPYLRNAILGFTLQSRWRNGVINSVQELELIIPDSFELLECDRIADIGAAGPFPDENAEGYHAYRFFNVRADESLFTSVRCEMGLSSADALPDLLANDKVTRTFIARALYTYTLAEDVRIRVAG